MSGTTSFLGTCKLIIFVDDLDRCEAEKCVEVLAAISLMTQRLPFVILDKIVQLPFSIPACSAGEKRGVVQGLFAEVVGETARSIAMNKISHRQTSAKVAKLVNELLASKVAEGSRLRDDKSKRSLSGTEGVTACDAIID
mmetsp:Transcript_10304/g.37974  ORF Transcript_10304/g.37974 Transcript_10304/m.37974 type:complete len:140 (+) Transcript_10304:177-596(+)